ncbi:MAG: hypothetical protein ACYC1E_03620 [Propionibacteriaceae bacterium]
MTWLVNLPVALMGIGAVISAGEWVFLPSPPALLWLQRVGPRPLAMYLAHLLLLAPVTLMCGDALYARAIPPVTLLEAALLVVALVHVLDRRGSPPWAVHLGGATPTAAQTGSTKK